MSQPPTVDPEGQPPRRDRAGVLVAVVIVAGLGLGGLAAVTVADREPSAPGDDRIRLALATQFGLTPEDTACVVTLLDSAGELDGDLGARLVDDALDGTPTSTPAVIDAVASCGHDRVVDVLVAAGVPEPVVGCAADTLADQPPAVLATIAEDPLAAGSAGRTAVSACALEHLATAVESGAGISGVDARCVAGDVLDRLGLEPVLASIGALAVTAAVEAAAVAAAESCA